MFVKIKMIDFMERITGIEIYETVNISSAIEMFNKDHPDTGAAHHFEHEILSETEYNKLKKIEDSVKNSLCFEVDDCNDPRWILISDILKKNIPGFQCRYGAGNTMTFYIPNSKSIVLERS